MTSSEFKEYKFLPWPDEIQVVFCIWWLISPAEEQNKWKFEYKIILKDVMTEHVKL